MEYARESLVSPSDITGLSTRHRRNVASDAFFFCARFEILKNSFDDVTSEPVVPSWQIDSMSGLDFDPTVAVALQSCARDEDALRQQVEAHYSGELGTDELTVRVATDAWMDGYRTATIRDLTNWIVALAAELDGIAFP